MHHIRYRSVISSYKVLPAGITGDGLVALVKKKIYSSLISTRNYSPQQTNGSAGTKSNLALLLNQQITDS